MEACPKQQLNFAQARRREEARAPRTAAKVVTATTGKTQDFRMVKLVTSAAGESCVCAEELVDRERQSCLGATETIWQIMQD